MSLKRSLSKIIPELLWWSLSEFLFGTNTPDCLCWCQIGLIILNAFPLRFIHLSDSRTASVSEKLPALLHELPQDNEAKQSDSLHIPKHTFLSQNLVSKRSWLCLARQDESEQPWRRRRSDGLMLTTFKAQDELFHSLLIIFALLLMKVDH